jgi:hypothetical protein
MVGSTTMTVCAACGELASTLSLHRSAIPFYQRVLRSWRYPLSSSGLISMAALSAVKKADYRQAVRALKAVMTSTPDDPIAPRACLLLARIYSERLSDPGTGDQLFRHVVQRYPNSQEAQLAQTRLVRKTQPSTA